MISRGSLALPLGLITLFLHLHPTHRQTGSHLQALPHAFEQPGNLSILSPWLDRKLPCSSQGKQLHVSGGHAQGSFLLILSHCTATLKRLPSYFVRIFSNPRSPPRIVRPYVLSNTGGLYLFKESDDERTETEDNAIANAAT